VNKIASRKHACRDRFECNRHVSGCLIFCNAGTIGVHDGIRATLYPRDTVGSNLSATRDEPLNCSNAGDGCRVDNVGAMDKSVDRVFGCNSAMSGLFPECRLKPL